MDHGRNSRGLIDMGQWSRRLGYLSIVAFALAMTSVVWAETGSAIPDAPDAVETTPELSPAQQRRWAERELGNVERSSKRVSRMLDKARQEQDMIRITCLNDKLTQLNKNLDQFNRRFDQHEKAVDRERQDHYYSLMVILSDRAKALRIEAEACVGGNEISFGETDIEVTIDPSITDDDPTDNWVVDEGEFLGPGTGSGYY